jgi:hypothetical protein
VTEIGSEILKMIDKEKQQELLHQELLHQELLHQEVNNSDHQWMVNQGSRVEPKAFQVYLTHHRIFYSNQIVREYRIRGPTIGIPLKESGLGLY